jgi:hypothetical protein
MGMFYAGLQVSSIILQKPALFLLLVFPDASKNAVQARRQ